MSEPKFTDRDLKRLKDNGPEWELSYEKLKALLGRLEAAEAYAEAKVNGSEQMQTLWKAWRKVSGK